MRIIETEFGVCKAYTCEVSEYQKPQQKLLNHLERISRSRKKWRACEQKLVESLKKTDHPHEDISSDEESFSSGEEQARKSDQEELYKASVIFGIDMLKRNYLEYEKTPETHPYHLGEVLAFHSQNRKGTEWKHYWTKCLKKWYLENVDKVKSTFKMKFNLTDEDWRRIEGIPIPLVTLSDESNLSPVSSKRSLSFSDSVEGSPNKRTKLSRCISKSSGEQQNYISLKHRLRDDLVSVKNGEALISIRSTFRFLSALKNEFGLRTPKVIDLLTKAVLSGNSNEPDSQGDNQNIFNSIKENLTRVLLSGDEKTLNADELRCSVRQLIEGQNGLGCLIESWNKENLIDREKEETHKKASTVKTDDAEKRRDFAVCDNKRFKFSNFELQLLLRGFSELESLYQESLLAILAKVGKMDLMKYKDVGDDDID